MVYFVYCLTNLLFFDILLLHYYTNLRWWLVICLSLGDINLYLSISLSCSSVAVSKLFCCEVFETFVILSAILLPIKSPAVYATFWIAFLKQF